MRAWQPKFFPKPHDTAQGERTFEGLLQWAKTDESAKGAHAILQSQASFVTGIAGCSPYLGQLMILEPQFTCDILMEGPASLEAVTLSTMVSQLEVATSEAELMAALRIGKRRFALLTAMADIGGDWNLMQVTQSLSLLADVAMDYTLAYLIHSRMKSGEIAWPHGEERAATQAIVKDCGLVILALGKLGGCELNYSSDIDLIALFDPEKINYIGRKSVSDCLVKICQDFVRILSKRTNDGYVFRTDFRLRPDPSSNPLAVSINAAEVYYQSVGQNWERSAMIKARCAAGDKSVGEDFLERIRPFVWRKNLDFAAIEDIHSIKAKVHSHHNHQGIRVKGHDVKLGYGGIREIEFMAQIQQLVFGGREPRLRSRSTLQTLLSMHELDKISTHALEELSQSYEFLRQLEHRLQMINDEQTHTIPEEDRGIAHIATFMGFHDVDDFNKTVQAHLTRVQRYFDDVTGRGEAASSAETLPVGDDLLNYLGSIGYADPSAIAATITDWRNGKYRCLKTERSRVLLEAFLPELLKNFVKTEDPQTVLLRFDLLLTGLPSGIQLFSMFQANPWLFTLLAKILSIAPTLAEQLGRKPRLLDTVLSLGFFDTLPSREQLQDSFNQHINQASDFQDTLDISRRWLNDMKFETGIHMLEMLSDITKTSASLTNIADVAVAGIIPAVEHEFAAQYGTIKGSSFGVIALGSFGGGDLSYTSDLDMILLYEVDDSNEKSNGPRSLSPSHYYTRLGQHFITAISAMTGEGKMYDIDLRLRPSGRDGPLVISCEAFEEYQMASAWTWEKMALTKSRIIYGTESFRKNVESVITSILSQSRDINTLHNDVKKMREKVSEEFGTDDIWNIRHTSGGLVDIEFITQFLLLKHAHKHPAIIKPSIEDALRALLKTNLIPKDVGEKLIYSHKFLQTLQQLMRLCLGDRFDTSHFSFEMKALLSKALNLPAFEQVCAELKDVEQTVANLYETIVQPTSIMESVPHEP